MLIRTRPGLTLHLVRWSVCGFAVLASLALAGAAPAAGSEDPGAVDQYQEQVPTAGGSQGTGGTGGSGGAGGDSNPLSTQVKDDLYQAAGQDAALLEQVATSSSYGAPVKVAGSPSPGSTEFGKKRIGEDSGTSSAISDAMTAVGDGDDGHLGVLAVLLGLIAASGVTASAYRRKRTGPALKP
jgi:hypothetical protein